MSTTINQEANKLNPDAYLELFTFDASVIGRVDLVDGPILYYTNTSAGSDSQFTNILWQGNEYLPLPFEVTGIDNKGDGTALARPTISLSNVHKTLMLAVLTLGDLVGMKVTRCRTFYKFTDNGSEPNSLTHFPLEVYYITRKIIQNRQVLQFEMSNALDRVGLKLPRRQVLREGDGTANSSFPGVSRVRIR
jgi:lambda family phage minor tail protein L